MRKMEVEARKMSFAALCDDGVTPEQLIIAVMRGEEKIEIKGKQTKITKQMILAAQYVMPYRLPKLNSIDAQIKTVSMTQEEWIESMDKLTPGENDDG